MLSTDVPPPDLLLCHNDDEISQLKSGSCSNIRSDERVSDNNQNQVEVADLLKSGLDDSSNPLPKFSIRDYVFNTRGKDIETHWPFSPKNLQLCMNHGVKDVLPPFQALESVRKNPHSSVKSCAPIEENTIVTPAMTKLSRLGNHFPTTSSNHVCPTPHLEEDKEHPSTTRSLSHSRMNSAPLAIKSPSLEKPDEAQAYSKVKKCRLILKSSINIAEKKSNEELTISTSVMASETMASKVCPVCKTFTSSSNTTLNAHIDQCLSVESDTKWSANSKVIFKHRIKPRKTRLMVDIYETAQLCTLEDLDRRNGTKWASNLGVSVQNLVACNEVENLPIYSVNNEDKIDEGGVYFDSNGRKLRILSRFSDQQSDANAKDDCGLGKMEKRYKESKIVSNKKKNYLAQSHKLMRHPTYGRKSCCSPISDHCLEVTNGHQRKLPPEEDEEDFTQPRKACDQTKSDDFGMIKQWVGSKRTGLKRKINVEHDQSLNPNKKIKNSRVKSNPPSLGDNLIPKCSDSSFPTLATDQSHKSKENLSLNYHDEHMEHIRLRKREGLSLLESSSDRLVRSKSNPKQLKKGGINSVQKRSFDRPNGAYNLASSRSNKKLKSIKDFGSLKKTSSSAAILSGCKKLSSLRKNLLSVKRTSVSESKQCLGRKLLDFKNHNKHYMSESDEGLAEGYSTIPKQDKNMVDKEEVFVNSSKEGDTALNGSDASPGSNGHGGSKNINSFKCVDVPEVEIHDELEIPKSSDVAAFTAFGKFLDNPDIEVMIPHQHYSKAYDGHFLDEVVEIDSNEGQQRNYFVDVDPIPIPGPPGSFLPSPGRMGSSEEIQGSSSLTTCRVLSSEDECELINMESSISPISDTPFASNSVAARSEIVTKKEPTQQPQKFVANSQENAVELVSHMSLEAKFPTRGDCEPTSPSSSNPVLRLMGKNLMVMNKEDNNTSSQTRFSDNVGSSHIIIQNEHYRPFNHNTSKCPSIFNNARQFDFNSSNGSPEIAAKFRSTELSPNLSRVMISSKISSNGGLTSSLACQEYNFAPHQQVEKLRNANSWGGKPSEIIVIDDSPENEASLAVKATHGENNEGWGSSVGISEPRALWSDSRILNPHFSYHTRCYPIHSGSQMVSNANAEFPSSKGMNGNSVIWNHSTPEGSGMLRLNSSITSSTGHTRSSMYYSPGFSLPTNFN